MLVGALADTHDNVEQTEKARDLFKERGVGAIIHCGDYITPIVYDVLGAMNLPFYGVYGNNDYKEALAMHSHGQIKEEPYRFRLAEKRVMICHESKYLKSEQYTRDVDLVVYGQTHASEVHYMNKTLVVNPGEGCGWVTGISSVAIIDLETMKAEIVNLAI